MLFQLKLNSVRREIPLQVSEATLKLIESLFIEVLKQVSLVRSLSGLARWYRRAVVGVHDEIGQEN